MNVTSVHVIVKNKSNQILLTQRCDVPFWVIPGGHVQKGENPKIAACREFFEETGYQIKIIHLIAQYKSLKSGQTKSLFSGLIQKKLKPLDKKEVKNINWFHINKLPKPITLYEKAKIKDYTRYSGKVIKQYDYVNKKKELLNQIKNPILFFKLVTYFIYSATFGTKSFKI